MKPTSLPVQLANIPLELRKVPRWVMWSFVEVGDGDNKRWAKMPLQITGKAASSTNPDTWTDFLAVEQAYNTNKFDGIGFVFSEDDNLVGIDLDDCYDAALRSFSDAAMQQLADKVDGYMEISPSGTGVKIFTRSEPFASHADHAIGFEAYSKGRFFTVTGQVLSGDIPNEAQDLTNIIPERTMRHTGDAFGDYTAPLEGWDITQSKPNSSLISTPSAGTMIGSRSGQYYTINFMVT